MTSSQWELNSVAKYCNPAAVIISIPGGNIIRCNETASGILNYSSIELQEMNWANLLAGDDHLHLFMHQQIEEFSVKISIPDFLLNKKTMYCTGVWIAQQDGSPMLTCSLSDVFNIQQADLAEALLNNNAEESFLLLDENFHILSFNKSFQQFYYAYAGAIIEKGENIFRHLPNGSGKDSMDLYQKVLDGSTVYVDTVVEMARNQKRSYSIKYKPALDQHNVVRGVFISVTDVTERTATRQQLIATEKRYRALVENGADGVVIFDLSGRPFYVSPATMRILGYSEAECLHLDLFSLTHPKDLEKVIKAWKYVLASPGVPVTASASRLRHKDGSFRWLEGTLTNMLHEPSIGGILDNFRDITDKMQSQREILERQKLAEQAQANYREIFEKASDGIFICDLEKERFIDLNNKACEMFGRSKEEVLQVHPGVLMVDTPGFTVLDASAKLKQAAIEGPQLFEWICRHKDGTLNWLEVNLKKANIAGEDRIVGFIRVINERKIAQARSDFERRDKEALINNTEDLIWSIDDQYRLIAANQAFVKRIKEAIGIQLKPGDRIELDDKYPSVLLDLWRGLYQRALSGESFITEIHSPIFDNVPESWAEVRFNPIYDGAHITGVACYSRDTTPAKEVQSKLIAINKRLATAQQIAQMGYWKQDINTKAQYWSDEVYHIWGLSADRFQPTLDNFASTIHPDDKAEFRAARQAVIDGDKALDMEFRILMANNETKYVHVSGELSYNAAGECTGIEGMVQDITDRKIAELKLKALNKHLQEQAIKLAATNTELEHFAYIASHDLQEPLRMVTSFLTQLDKKYSAVIDDKGKQYIGFAVDGAKRMRQIILDLLDFSRAGRIEDDREEVDLNDLIEEVIPLVLQENDIATHTSVEIEGKLPLVYSHKTSLHQVFQNLISNGLKYSRKGVTPKVLITAHHELSCWRFSVQDNGIGIEQEYFEMVFVIFQRLHTRTEYPGTGIGLAITKKIVENLGGTIWLESIPGRGTTFHFTIEKN